MTVFAELLELFQDFEGYITYVFKLLDNDEISRLETKLIMCVRYPNWQTPLVNKGDIGYLNFKEVTAGVDTWFDGTSFIPYKYDDIQFVKFIKKEDNKNEFVL